MHLVQDPQKMRDEGPRPGQVWSLREHVVVILGAGTGSLVVRCAPTHDRPRLAGPHDRVNDGIVCPDLDYPVPLAWFENEKPLRDLGKPGPAGQCRHWRLVHKILRERFGPVFDDYFTWYDATYD